LRDENTNHDISVVEFQGEEVDSRRSDLVPGPRSAQPHGPPRCDVLIRSELYTRPRITSRGEARNYFGGSAAHSCSGASELFMEGIGTWKDTQGAQIPSAA